ncbi:hypothetical protein [Actinoplanes teichomyceticus]|uniref:hypothetical protein n=1 Tax=Actinoplanes teichomyceticus TaxID=1867 RepID=UPI0011A91071|nr:hypothetical protein [Actinoplanes teichomyceticus]GIF11643.1 hypothetical protein Ate01nite_16750 [Actinoplanes teichomyceticus]
MSAAYELAKLRALRILPQPLDRTERDALRDAALLAGRGLVDVSLPDGSAAVVLSWPDGHEPVVLSEASRSATSTVQLVLAACLRSCWPDPDAPPYPGVAATEEQVLTALEGLETPSAEPEESSRNGRYRARKSALRVLRACAFLQPDAGDGVVRLGPAVALWTPAEVAELRREHHVLPGRPEERT